MKENIIETTTGPPLRVVLVDDHPVVLAGLESLIGGHPGLRVVGSTCSGREAVGLVADLQPDVVVMDYFLKDGMEGTDLIRSVRAVGVRARIVVLTARVSGVLCEEAAACGADWVLPKNCAPEELFEAMTGMVGHVSRGNGATRFPQGLESLSLRERNVLRQIAEGNPVREIAEALGVSRKTVEAHRANIRVKLGIETSADLRRFARSHFGGLESCAGI